MTDEAFTRLLLALVDFTGDPLHDDANTTIRVGDLRALIDYHRTAQCSPPAARTSQPSSIPPTATTTASADDANAPSASAAGAPSKS